MNLILLKIINNKSLIKITAKIIRRKMNHTLVNIKNKLTMNNINSVNLIIITIFYIQE
jgi:hypothetical protein